MELSRILTQVDVGLKLTPVTTDQLSGSARMVQPTSDVWLGLKSQDVDEVSWPILCESSAAMASGTCSMRQIR